MKLEIIDRSLGDELDLEVPSFYSNDRVVILGIGSNLSGDDAAGIKVVEKIKEKKNLPKLLLVIGGTVPENFTSKVKDFKPTNILIIDAVDFGEEPGTISLVDSDKIVGQKISSHRLPLSMLIEYLEGETAAKIDLIGIQPARTGLGETMSKPVKEAVNELVRRLEKVLLERSSQPK